MNQITATDEFLQPSIHVNPMRTPSISASSPASFVVQPNHGNSNRTKANSKRFPSSSSTHQQQQHPQQQQQQQLQQRLQNSDQISIQKDALNSTNILASAAASMVNYFNSAINNSPSPGSVSIITISSDSEDEENNKAANKAARQK
jgi:hypothetical protein